MRCIKSTEKIICDCWFVLTFHIHNSCVLSVLAMMYLQIILCKDK